MTQKYKKLKEIHVKDYLIQLAGGISWADSGTPYAMGEPMKKRKKVLFFLKNTKHGRILQEYIRKWKSENATLSLDWKEEILIPTFSDKSFRVHLNWMEVTKGYYEHFCEQTKGLDLSKYGFGHRENFN